MKSTYNICFRKFLLKISELASPAASTINFVYVFLSGSPVFDECISLAEFRQLFERVYEITLSDSTLEIVTHGIKYLDSFYQCKSVAQCNQ